VRVLFFARFRETKSCFAARSLWSLKAMKGPPQLRYGRRNEQGCGDGGGHTEVALGHLNG